MAGLHTLSVFASNLLRGNRGSNIFFIFRFDARPGVRTRVLRLTSQYSAYDLVSPATHIVCVNFERKWRNLQFNVESERQIFEKLFNGRFILFTLRVFDRNVRRGNLFVVPDLGHEPGL